VDLQPRSPRFDDGISVDSSNEIVPNLWIGRLEIQPAEAFEAGFEVVIMLEEVTTHDVRPPRGGVFSPGRSRTRTRSSPTRTC
jgi:hypothetical protein